MRWGRCHRDESGFTTIEVLVAGIVLVVGLLGAATMLVTADRTTSDSIAREGATTLTREVIERARQTGYDNLASPTVGDLVRAALPDATRASGVNSRKFVIPRRQGVSYTVGIASCKVDDASDGIGVHDSTYCDRGSGDPDDPTDPGNGGSSVGLTLAGLTVTVPIGGTLVDTLCTGLLGANPIGTNPVLDGLLGRENGAANRILALARSGADVNLCPGGSGTSGQFALDDDPDDFTRVTATVSWKTPSGKDRTWTQSTLIANPT